MVQVIRRANSLQRRIAAGQADPISDHEREQLEEVRRTFVRRFGKEPDARPTTKTARRLPIRSRLRRVLDRVVQPRTADGGDIGRRESAVRGAVPEDDESEGESR